MHTVALLINDGDDVFAWLRVDGQLMVTRGGGNIIIVQMPEKFCIGIAVCGRENSGALLPAGLQGDIYGGILIWINDV